IEPYSLISTSTGVSETFCIKPNQADCDLPMNIDLTGFRGRITCLEVKNGGVSQASRVVTALSAAAKKSVPKTSGPTGNRTPVSSLEVLSVASMRVGETTLISENARPGADTLVLAVKPVPSMCRMVPGGCTPPPGNMFCTESADGNAP